MALMKDTPQAIKLRFLIVLVVIAAIDGICLNTQIVFAENASAARSPGPVLSTTQHSNLDTKDQWTWVDKSGRTRTRADLDKILTRHDLWLKTKGRKGARAVLDGSKLKGAKLRNAILQQLSLGNADLSASDLSNSDLTSAYLKGADLSQANLANAVLKGTQMEEATLRKAILTGANC